MSDQDFDGLAESGLLRAVEDIIVDGHRKLYEIEGRPWSRPQAYRWLRYEDPAPVARLVEGMGTLRAEGVKFDPDAVDKACIKAAQRGYLN